MYIPRVLNTWLKDELQNPRKVAVLYGPRQVGKTTLIKEILGKSRKRRLLSINADEKKYLEVLSSRNFAQLDRLTDGYEILFIDEAQRVPDIGINLKILHDQKPDLKIIVTGSSSFDLANNINEPLTGRTRIFILYPIAIMELRKKYNAFELQDLLEQLLLFGSYPEVFSIKKNRDKEDYVNELTTSYLFKDILALTNIKHANKLLDLLRLLAFQIGSEVSMNELGSALNMSKETVESYIDLLEKAFVVFRLSGYSRNLRKEVTKMNKVYFYDLGIRNAVINNFNPLKFRDDIGKLWENFMIIERKKTLAYQRVNANDYFWRTYTGAELDYIEERNGQLFGYEFKYSSKKFKPVKSWKENYPKATQKQYTKDNFLDLLLEKIR